MNKRFFAILLTLVLLTVPLGIAFAETGTVGITGGTLGVTAADVTLSGVTLDGTDKTATSASGSNSWSAQDSRGTGLGWNVTIVAEDFSDGVDKSIDISETDQEFKIQLLDENISVTAGNTKPTSSVTSLTAIDDTTPLKFASAAVGAGMGTYSISPNFELEIPAETYLGSGSYSATITVSAVSGP